MQYEQKIFLLKKVINIKLKKFIFKLLNLWKMSLVQKTYNVKLTMDFYATIPLEPVSKRKS